MDFDDPSNEIKGWLHPIAGGAIQSLMSEQESNGVKGNLLEIGVYLGKTLAYFVNACKENERPGKRLQAHFWM